MTKGTSAIRNPQYQIVWLLFAGLIFVVYFIGLSLPLVGPDEPRYSQVAREMFERGDWITPTLGGFHWFEKPALLYWLQIASYNLFGVSEFAARFGSALFGVGTVASLWILGKYVEKQESGNSFANQLGLIAASTVGIIVFAHGASFDIILTFPITAAMVSFFVYDVTKRSMWLVSFYFFIGLSLLAKGLIGIVFPFGIVGLYHVLLWKVPGRKLLFSILWGTLLSAAVASLWYLPMYMRHGWQFVDEFFVQHHFQRYTSNKYLHPQPFYFFFWVLPLMTIPWLPFFLASIWKLAKQSFPDRRSETRSALSPLHLFSIAWLLVPLIFFSFSGSKLPGYILPAVPPAIILTADYIHRFVRSNSWRRYLVPVIALATLAIVLLTVTFLARSFAEADSVKGLFELASQRNLDSLPVLMLHGVSHNAEFYAPGRIVRDEKGKQKTLYGPLEVLREIRIRDGQPVLVLVRQDFAYQLIQSDVMSAEVLKANDEWSLVLVDDK